MKTAKQLLTEALKHEGADGFCNVFLECGCSIEDLCPCESCDLLTCIPAKYREAQNDFVPMEEEQ